MPKKEVIVEKLNELIFKFEGSANIANYAIIFGKRVVMGPNATSFTKKYVLDIASSLDLEKFEKLVQKGDLKILEMEFEGDSLFYIKCTPEVRVIGTPNKASKEESKKILVGFAEEIKEILKPDSETGASHELEEKINQSLVNLEAIVDGITIPKFERFKNLVKFAIPFQKKD